MIVDLTLRDNTQIKVIEQLKQTEKLIATVATKLSKGKRECNIYAMPDLGIASNITRMCGGMYTGSCYTWETDEPFIPIDSTVNVCGTAIFKLKREITPKEFRNRVEKEFKDKIINIHPSLIPSFCGKGYYGEKVHQGVIDYGAKVTGATVHFVDEGADTGAIIMQETVNVEQDDDAKSLAKRVLEVEHRILKESIRLFCENKLSIQGRRVFINE